MSKAMNTRRAYHMVSISWHFGYWTPNKGRTRAEVRRLVDRVWANEAPHRRKPDLVFLGPGSTAYYMTVKHYIALSDGHLCYDTVLHELAHALGHYTHGPGFIKCWIRLLAKYARCDELLLLTYAKLIGYKL